MKKFAITCCLASIALLLSVSVATADLFDGAVDNAYDDGGYYYMMTGGKFPTGNVPNGNNGSSPNGGTFRFISDDPTVWGRNASEAGVWQKDDWFDENASYALTLKNGTNIVYDNNGIEDGTYGDYYDASALAVSAQKPGLYRGFSMSNNYDWIYAGYFMIEEATTITEMIGYFDETSGFDRNSPMFRYRMNIWSNVDGDLLPTDTGSFDGDVLTSDSYGGTFATSDTDVDRIFGQDYGCVHDDIFRLTYTLSQPMTLQPGIYWFSHDAYKVPEPASVGMGILALSGLTFIRRRK